MPKGMLIDTTLCVGCGMCEEACDQANGLPVQKDDRLHANTFTYVAEPQPGVYARHQCFHCVEPACASVCPVAALKKTADGPVVYDSSRCMGCRYCMMACPFKVPTYEWTSVTPRVRKCIMCSDRLAQGKPTACSEACPTGATLFGERDELLQTARERIAQEPGKYYPAIFGEHEVGGTSVFYLASVDFAKLGLPNGVPTKALPHYTWEALSEIPTIVTAGVPLLWGIWWITNRREEVAAAERRALAGRTDMDEEERR
ncbi:MAG: 4Fe-4S dicluster domain-containing protein [Acidobacteria bacterium]|nr:4Fe-4S dicluster domain-containing protein [Acidobacteriota bacterium]